MSLADVEQRCFGPPGTGKTTYLSRQIHRAYEKYGDQVIVASFTRAAAIEIAGRDLPIPKKRIGTLHSFCFHALGEPEIADTPKWIKVWNETHAVPMSATKSLDDPLGMDASSRSDSDKLLSAYSRHRTQLKTADELDAKLVQFAEEWDAFKEEHGLMDFTDLIVKSLEYVEHPPYPFRVAFYDETQDFSPAELALVRKWGSHAERFVLAGDDDQCIYHFRGATPEAFLEPKLPEKNYHYMPYSYRLPRKIKKFADEWIRHVARRHEKPFDPRGADGDIHHSPLTINNGLCVAQSAWERAKAGQTAMILTTCSFMLQSVIKNLKLMGIPFHNPYRTSNGAWNPWRGGIDRLKAFLVDDVELHGHHTKPHTWETVWKWIEVVDSKKAGMRQGIKKTIKGLARDKDAKTQELSPDDWKEIGIPEPNGDIAWFQRSILPSKSKLMAYAFHVAKRQGMYWLRNKPRVVVGTIHSVKGGEADVVYLFPDISLAALQEIAAERRPAMDALRRTYYVGMTRAAGAVPLPAGVKKTLG